LSFTATEGKGKEGEIGEHGIHRSLLLTTCDLQDQKMKVVYSMVVVVLCSTRESRWVDTKVKLLVINKCYTIIFIKSRNSI
jgi:hypothetical protein